MSIMPNFKACGQICNSRKNRRGHPQEYIVRIIQDFARVPDVVNLFQGQRAELKN